MITITRGDSQTFTVVVYSDSGLTTKQDLTGVTGVRFSGRAASEAGALVFQKTLDEGVTITDATKGEMEIMLAPEDTASLPPRQVQLAYDVELTWTGGTVTTVDLGMMSVRPDVSY